MKSQQIAQQVIGALNARYGFLDKAEMKDSDVEMVAEIVRKGIATAEQDRQIPIATDDSNACQRLRVELLTPSQRRFLDSERVPHWELNPPQREDYDTPRDYILALGRYANAFERRDRGLTCPQLPRNSK